MCFLSNNPIFILGRRTANHFKHEYGVEPHVNLTPRGAPHPAAVLSIQDTLRKTKFLLLLCAAQRRMQRAAARQPAAHHGVPQRAD